MEQPELFSTQNFTEFPLRQRKDKLVMSRQQLIKWKHRVFKHQEKVRFFPKVCQIDLKVKGFLCRVPDSVGYVEAFDKFHGANQLLPPASLNQEIRYLDSLLK